VKRETILAQAGSRWDERTGAVSVPIYQTATFRHPALGQSTGFDYSRSGNPTRAALEETLAALDGGARGLAFASGLAAISCLLHLLAPGDRVLVTEDLYGGTLRLLRDVYGALGLTFTTVDTADTAAVERAWTPDVKLLLVETPTNPMLKIADLSALAQLAHARGALLAVDNTFLTAALQRPLALGADVAVYSASKYLSGHNDVVAGALVAASPEVGQRLAFFQNAVGAVLGPQDSWLALRGMKTLSVRLERQQQTALAVARFLSNHPHVARVHYPGLPDHPGHEVLKRQSDGFGAMVSFDVDDPARVPRLLERVNVWLFAESLGGVESLVTFPAVQTHADIPRDERDRLGISHTLLRLSVGLEHADDLTADLDQALL
jgi:cystathionine gamma-synthase/cystathionine beta-lyase